MKLTEEEVSIRGGDTPIRAVVLRPDRGERWPGVVFYTDIFQLTSSTLRTARRLASHGFVVCVPEIYPREFAGVALPFDDAGKDAGLAGAAHTPTAVFDADRTVVLDYLAGRPDVEESLRSVGFCLGGHIAFRAGFDPRVGATACYYPTGLHDGALGSDDAGTLADVGRMHGRLMLVFGSRDPHVPAEARLQILAELQRQGVDTEVSIFDAEHAFMRDEGPRHDPALTDIALELGVGFLSRP